MGDSMSKARDYRETMAGQDAERSRRLEWIRSIRGDLEMPPLAGRVWDARLPQGVRRVLCEAGRISTERAECRWASLSSFERSCIQGAAARLKDWATLMTPDMGDELIRLQESEAAAADAEAKGEGAA